MIGVFLVYIRPADEELQLPLPEVGVCNTLDSSWQVIEMPEQVKEKKRKKKEKWFLCVTSIICCPVFAQRTGATVQTNVLYLHRQRQQQQQQQ